MAKKLTEKMLERLVKALGPYEMQNYLCQLCGEVNAAWSEWHRGSVRESWNEAAVKRRYYDAVEKLMIWMPVFYYAARQDEAGLRGRVVGMEAVEGGWEKLKYTAEHEDCNLAQSLGGLFFGEAWRVEEDGEPQDW